MSFVKKLFGIDDKAQRQMAELQAQSMRDSAQATQRQAQAVAQQTAQQARLAQERARVEEQVRLMQQTPTEEAQVDIGEEGGEESPTRRRRAYQNPNTAPGVIRI